MSNATAIVGLWVTPYFTEAMARGEEAAPYVDHDDVDWLSLLSFLRDTFNADNYGVSVRVANDTIDPAVLGLRDAGEIPGSLACEDFAQLLYEKSFLSVDEVIPIRDEWQSLQYLKDRNHAPPPAIIVLSLSGEAAEVALYVREIQMRLGVKAAHDLITLMGTPTEELPEDFYQGYLFPEFSRQLEQSFGLRFERPSLVNFMVPIDPGLI